MTDFQFTMLQANIFLAASFFKAGLGGYLLQILSGMWIISAAATVLGARP